MVEHLETELNGFSRGGGHVRCFGHIIQLVSKALMKHFDAPKKDDKRKGDDTELDDLVDDDNDDEPLNSLDDLAEDTDEGAEDDLPGLVDISDEDEWVEEATAMNEEQLAEFYAAVRPVRLRSLASTVNKSTTILLPTWKQHLADLNLPERMLRQDVRTRWQSTNDMVVNAVGMKRAIRSFCADGDLGVDLDKFRMNARGTADCRAAGRRSEGAC
ncbi:uncharacterized protein BXZ73DRAFT_58606 [Epithele typhae]|uniref:uncharacterized protein n=1 Tax=Epithele typhae TaxID=378194 RepID=UPI0020074273|nr:uncharacterized protein BXZ73DRAFT_58606 [Epithele typhae]KAH9910381.1 hypothetical protein BXZ73DRAFT_58606 [Epithele typhae]